MSSILCHHHLLNIEKPIVMAIINNTPDSFYDSCRQMEVGQVVAYAERGVAEGASILDIGGYSTRPGASKIPLEEEWRRVEMAGVAIRKHLPEIPLSVDTFRAEIARRSVDAFGACMVNDISGGELDSAMFQTVAQLKVAYVLMHSRGDAQTMQQQTTYDDMLSEIVDFFQERIYKLKQLGVCDIVLDPGFGFAKTVDQNYELLAKMDYFSLFNLPVLVGMSRKSMIYKLLETTPQEALNGTTVLHTMALLQGASILRVHDVKEAMEAIRLVEALKGAALR